MALKVVCAGNRVAAGEIRWALHEASRNATCIITSLFCSVEEVECETLAAKVVIAGSEKLIFI